MDRTVNLSKGFGFVEFAKRADAMNAIKHLDGSLLDGNTIPVAISQPQRRSPPPPQRHYGPGPGGGRGPPPRGRSPFRRCAAATSSVACRPAPLRLIARPCGAPCRSPPRAGPNPRWGHAFNRGSNRQFPLRRSRSRDYRTRRSRSRSPGAGACTELSFFPATPQFFHTALYALVLVLHLLQLAEAVHIFVGAASQDPGPGARGRPAA